MCAASIVDTVNSFDARNARVTFLSCDGKVHRSSFDENGRLEYAVEQRTVGYGEADLSVPLEMAAAGPDVHWELWTIGARPPAKAASAPTDPPQTGTRPLWLPSWD